MNRWYTVSVAMSLVVIVALIGLNMMESEKNNDHIMQMKLELEALKIEQGTIEYLVEMIEEYQSEINRLRETLERFDIQVYEITNYAPLDPNAIEGMCYSGDQNITASGNQVEIGLTAAASRDIPFGTRVWIEGFGWREVWDRGGMITEGKLDIAVDTKQEAFRFGRKDRVVVLEMSEQQ